jgi:CRP/FNR family cyclic AMP-dependent transcriptional regulator
VVVRLCDVCHRLLSTGRFNWSKSHFAFSPMLPPSPIRSERRCGSCELRSLRMFCNLDAEALADFEKIGVQATLPRGATLFDEDTTSNGVFVICTGQVKLSCTSKEGKTLILKIAMPGDVLGLGAVISGAKYEVTAQTVQPTQIKSIRREEFLSFLTKHGEASLHAAKALSEEYKAAFFDARRLALSGSAAGRLASVLLDWGKAASCGKPEMRFTMALTHEELANLVGSSRETVTRMLSRFKREKLIQMRGASILVLSPERLEQLSA